MPLGVYAAAAIFWDDGTTERAYELLSLVDYNGTHVSRRGMPLLAKLDVELPPNLAAAVERGKRLDIDATLQQLVVEFSGDNDHLRQAAPLVATQSAVTLLSERELEVLRLVAEGMSDAEIAQKLFLSIGTIKVHTRNIYDKLGVGSRTQAVAKAQQLTLL
jgi:DNA-binding NarL/FixJ family response regulator